MKKIIYVVDFGSDRRTGGGATFSRGFLKILERLPIELTVLYSWCPGIDGESPWGGKNFHMLSIPRRFFGKVSGEIISAFKAWRIAKNLPDQDLFIFDTPSIAARFLPSGVPTCAMAHGSEYVRWSDFSFIHLRSTLRRFFWKKPFINPIQKNLLLLKNGVPFFNSRHTMRKISQDFGISESKLNEFVTYLPVDTAAYSRNGRARIDIREKYGIKDDEVVIACVSNFADYKRPQFLPPIVRDTLKKVPPAKVRFFFVGRKNPSSAPLEEFIASSESRGRCIRLFEVPPGEVRNIYSAADIALCTSASETFGYFVAEGMSASLPFVAYDNSGAITELIEDNITGFLVKTEEEFVLRLTSLISDTELRRKMGYAGLERVDRLFSIDAFQRRIVDIINKYFKLDI